MMQQVLQRFLARRDLLRMGLGTTAGIAGAAALNRAGIANSLHPEVGAGGHDGDIGGDLGGQPADGPRCAAQPAARVAEGRGLGADAVAGAADEGGVDLTDGLSGGVSEVERR